MNAKGPRPFGRGVDPARSDIRAKAFLSPRAPSSPRGFGHRRRFLAPSASLARKRTGIGMYPACFPDQCSHFFGQVGVRDRNFPDEPIFRRFSPNNAHFSKKQPIFTNFCLFFPFFIRFLAFFAPNPSPTALLNSRAKRNILRSTFNAILTARTYPKSAVLCYFSRMSPSWNFIRSPSAPTTASFDSIPLCPPHPPILTTGRNFNTTLDQRIR